jgi:hypothetical protein
VCYDFGTMSVFLCRPNPRTIGNDVKIRRGWSLKLMIYEVGHACFY